MTPTAPPCDRCGEPHDPRRCTGHAKRSGRQCQSYPLAGGTVCRKHGGSAPQVRAANARNVAAARVERVAARLGYPIDIDPRRRCCWP